MVDQMSIYTDLSPEMQERVKQFIEKNIDSVYDERKAYGTYIDEYDSVPAIRDSDEIKNESIESTFVAYWCNVCHTYTGVSDYALIMHVLGHLGSDINES